MNSIPVCDQAKIKTKTTTSQASQGSRVSPLDVAESVPQLVPQLSPVLAVNNLSFSWPASPSSIGITALDVKPSEHWLLEGPSGSGKSTLLQLLGGVLLPQRGEIRILGQHWAELSAAQRDQCRADHVGFIFQQFNLIPYLSVLDNVLLPCRFSPLRRQAAETGGKLVDEAQRLLCALGLGTKDLQNRRAVSLSVAQQQGVASERPDVAVSL